jgi:hypothetical protein
MSDTKRCAAGWHTRCLSSCQQRRKRALGRKKNLADTKKIAEARRRPYSTGYELQQLDNNNDDDTPPQIKQATNPCPTTGVFFRLRFVGAFARVGGRVK